MGDGERKKSRGAEICTLAEQRIFPDKFRAQHMVAFLFRCRFRRCPDKDDE